MEFYHLEWGDGEITSQILAWKFPLVQGRVRERLGKEFLFWNSSFRLRVGFRFGLGFGRVIGLGSWTL